ncbi:MAG: flagellar motor protein MotB [SAR324 cluster bacterium]|nr:flagellar motor protein MotB [SAR324 cluster bacterium]
MKFHDVYRFQAPGAIPEGLDITVEHSRFRPTGDSNTVMMTSLSLILLAFFILLYAMSSPNNKKQAKIALEIKRAFESIGGILNNTGPAFETGRGTSKEKLEVSAEVETFLSELQGYSEEDRDLEQFSYEVTNEALLIHIPTRFAFQENSTEIQPKAYPFMDKIYNFIERSENRVRIEGHTDDVPFRVSDFDPNWTLSADRSMRVLRYFLKKSMVPASRFAASGYSSQRPLASNRFSEGREKNRRITIVIVNPVHLLGGPLGTGP